MMRDEMKRMEEHSNRQNLFEKRGRERSKGLEKKKTEEHMDEKNVMIEEQAERRRT